VTINDGRFYNVNARYMRWAISVFLALALSILPFIAVDVASAGLGASHHFWGKVTTTGGAPGVNVQVTIWVNGVQGETITTDDSGQFGSDPLVDLPHYLSATGRNGDLIVLKVNGVAAEVSRLGTLIESPPVHWEWQIQNPPLQSVVFHEGQVNGLDLVYNIGGSQDSTPPAAINDLATTEAFTDTVKLTWTAPGDDGTTGQAIAYDIRYRTGGAVTNASWATATQVIGEPVPQATGSTETFTVSGLNDDTTYYFAIKTADEVPNWSAISNSPSMATANDDTGTSGFVDHFWGKVIATGGAPAVNVQVTAWVNGLRGNTITTDDSGQFGTDLLVSMPYYLTVNGQNGNLIVFRVNDVAAEVMRIGTLIESPPVHWEWELQNPPLPSIVFIGGQVNGLDLVYNPGGSQDTTSPAAVTDLATGSTTTSSIILTWTAPGDDGTTGQATAYDIRYRTGGVINEANWATATQISGEPVPQAGGSTEAFTVTGLDAGTTYYFAIKTADEVPNWSALSNSPSGTTAAAPDTTSPAVVTDLATGDPTTTSIKLTWTAPGDDGSTGTATSYDIRYRTGGAVSDASWDSATPASSVPVPKSGGSTETFTVTGLDADTTYYFAIKTADEVPNWSVLSNSPSGTTAAAPDTTSPAVVTDLATGGVSTGSIDLTWTTPGVDYSR